MSHADAAREMYAAFLAKDRETAERLLSDNFTFTSPHDDHIDRTAFFERCWPNSNHMKTQTVERVFERGDEVVVEYLCTTTNGTSFENMELLRFDGDRIASVDVYFGASYLDGKLIRS
jgi:ketosteroid isomerase-like protein